MGVWLWFSQQDTCEMSRSCSSECRLAPSGTPSGIRPKWIWASSLVVSSEICKFVLELIWSHWSLQHPSGHCVSMYCGECWRCRVQLFLEEFWMKKWKCSCCLMNWSFPCSFTFESTKYLSTGNAKSFGHFVIGCETASRCPESGCCDLFKPVTLSAVSLPLREAGNCLWFKPFVREKMKLFSSREQTQEF